MYIWPQVNFVFAGYKESYCVLEYNITCVAVNFYWSELDTSSGQIYCTVDILDIVHSYNREWIYCILDIVHILEQTVQLC